MKALNLSLATAALVAVAPALHAETAAERGEKRLAQMIGDRIAGEPVQCFEYLTAPRRPTNFVVIDGVAVVYDLGDVMYVGRPVNAIDPRDTIMDRVRGTQVCADDKFYTISRRGGPTTGYVDMREFVPYRRER